MTAETSREMLALANYLDSRPMGNADINWKRKELIISALRLAAKPADEGVREDESRYIKDIIRNAMLTAWNEICSDTGHHPLDVKHGGNGRKLYFAPRHWAQMTADIAAEQILKLALSPTPEQKP